MEEYERKWYIETKSGVTMKRRQNTIPRVKKLRAKYRKQYGDDWWTDPDVKEEYIEEKKALSRKSSGTSTSSPKKRKSTRKKSKSSKKSRAKESSYDIMKHGVDAGHVSEDWLHVPNDVQEAYFKIVDKLEELPDSLHNDTGLFHDHEIDGKKVIMRLKLKEITTNYMGIKGRPRLMVIIGKNIEISGTTIGDTDSNIYREYKLSSTTAAFNYIKKWIESHLQKANPRRRNNPMYLITLDEGKGDGEMHYLVENAKNATEAKKKFLANRFPLRSLGRNATIKASLYKGNGN